MLRAVCLALLVLLPAAAFAGITLKGDLSRTEVYDKLEEIGREEETRRDRLLASITSPDRATRRLAVAELRGGFADDPKVTDALLTMLRAEAGGAGRLPTEARTDVLYLLAGAEDAAWTPESVTAARGIVEAYAAAEHVRPGDRERGLLDALEDRLATLAGTRAAFGIVSEGALTRARYTDVDVFVCDYAAEDAELVEKARRFAEGLAGEDFGRIRLRRSSEELAKEVGAAPGASTVVYDAGHREEKEGHRLEEMLTDAALPAPRRVANAGVASYWYLSVFVCP